MMKRTGFSRALNIFLLTAIFVGSFTTLTFGESSSEPFLKGWAAYENKDFASALKLWRPLAEKGNPDAQYLLGILFTNGLGVPVNFTEAGVWFYKSAQQGDVGAQYFLADFLETGKGQPQDVRQAGYWFSQAANQGYPDAQYRLGKWHADGKGGTPDLISAYIWLSQADANGIQTAKPRIREVEKHLTSEQLTEARRLAHRLWLRLEEK